MQRVLVVEDDENLCNLDKWRWACRREVKDKLYDFDIAKSGRMAIEKIKADKDGEIKVLVVDLRMPGDQGVEGEGFLKWLKYNTDFERYAIILFTAFPDRAADILKLLGFSSWILTKGTPVNQLGQLRPVLNDIMIKRNNVIEDPQDLLPVLSEAIHSFSDPQELKEVRVACIQLFEQRKRELKDKFQKCLRDWVRHYQEQGLLSAEIPIDDDSITLYISPYLNRNYKPPRTFYRIAWKIDGKSYMITVPLSLVDSLPALLRRDLNSFVSQN